MLRRTMIIALLAGIMVFTAGVPVERAFADEKSEKKEKKKEKKSKGSEGSEKSGGSRSEVNKIYDGFKKGSGAAKDDAGKARKSVNDTYDRTK